MKKIAHWLLFAVALIAAGCGGGGGGGSSSGGSGVNLFLTDDMSNSHSAVWVRILRVELESTAGRTTIFESSEGKTVNLRALNDGSPRYAFLGRDGVPAGTYSGIRFTLEKDVRVTPNGSNSTNLRSFDDVYLDPGNPNQAILTLSFPAPKTIGAGSNDLVCDFVLSSWVENGTKIQNALVEDAPTSGLSNSDRHDDDEFKGTISNLAGTSPNFTFTLTSLNGNSVPVATDANTAIFNNDGSANPQLANGRRVELRGLYSPIEGRVLAQSIKLKSSSGNDGEDPHGVKGLAENINADLGTFDVVLGRADGFLPTEAIVHVAVTDTTRFFSHGGIPITRADFFAAIQAGGFHVEAEGVRNAATNTLTAIKAKLEDDDNGHEAEAKGTPSAIDAAAGTFRLQLGEWYGFSATSGSLVDVVTSPGTRFRDIDGESITKEQFFAQLATANAAKAEGSFSNGTITATQVRIREHAGNGGGGGGGGQAEAYGSGSNANLGARSFDIRLVQWSGMTGTSGQVIHVVMTAGATFRNDEGDNVSAEVFFSLLTNGHPVEAEGSYNAATSTLTAHKAKLED